MGREGSHDLPPDRPPNPVYRKEIPHPRQPIIPFIQGGWDRPRYMTGQAVGPRCLRKEGLWGANKILPCAVNLNGEYDMTRLFVGVPVKLGRGRIEQVVEINLTSEEKAALEKSVAAVRELVDKLKL